MNRPDLRGLAWLLLFAATSAAASDMGMGPEKPMVFLSADRLEAQFRDGDDARLWDLEGWIGSDLNKAWFKAEGEDVSGEGVERAELQALYSRAVAPFWDLQLGVRYDFRPNPSKAYAVAGIEGLAPYRIETEAAAFVSEDGDASLRVELEYDLRLTQQWILRPRAEFGFAFSQVSELNVGTGFNKFEGGLRLNYAIRPEISPYVGLDFESALGNSRSLVRADGDERSSWGAVVGISAWF